MQCAVHNLLLIVYLLSYKKNNLTRKDMELEILTCWEFLSKI